MHKIRHMPIVCVPGGRKCVLRNRMYFLGFGNIFLLQGIPRGPQQCAWVRGGLQPKADWFVLSPCLSWPSALRCSNANMCWNLASRLSSSKKKAICWSWQACVACSVSTAVGMLSRQVASANQSTIFIFSKRHSSSNIICRTWSSMPKHGRNTMNFLLTTRRRIWTARSSA